ncbi:hypothetical protein F8M41_013584 [Gigaspora margarita]|uniref:Uncharacterized protein n=1 Tax=Gigaspora margarita TaxID=4874 RepID=A0A8H3WYG8_GIGMA|nr:hypothetical protein F8M41_013584 [Gigaspora margarita]
MSDLSLYLIASNQSNEKTIRVYSQKYIPNNLSPSQEEFFKQADDCFGYSSNFNQTFSVCFCSTCHSKYVRIKSKSNTTDIEKLNTTNTKQSESSLYNNSTNCNSKLKFKLFVENKNENILSGKSIMTKLVNFEEFKNLIQQWICKINNNYSIVMSNYSLLYKVEHSRTGAMILQDNDDWKEFLKQ